jgi:hypothetical protein
MGSGLTPVAATLTQEGIDVLVILNALRALLSGRRAPVQAGPGISSEGLRCEHRTVEENLDRLREIADALDDATGAAALALITKANEIVQQTVVQHEREHETALYPKLSARTAFSKAFFRPCRYPASTPSTSTTSFRKTSRPRPSS